MITLDGADLPPALMAPLKHAAPMPDPIFYERQRRRASTWDTPRFLLNYDETITDDLVQPRGLRGRLEELVSEAGSRFEVADETAPGQPQDFTLQAKLDPSSKPPMKPWPVTGSGCSSLLLARARP